MNGKKEVVEKTIAEKRRDQIVNTNGIPNIIYEATRFEWYSGAEVKKDFSVTELLKPPLIKRLEEKYFEKTKLEASDQLWTMMGSALHHILECGAKMCPDRYILEKRMTEEFFGKMVSGQMDVYDILEQGIEDHKYTSIWKYVFRNKGETMAEWTFQLNVYRLLALKAGLPVKKLSINLIFRDFELKKAEAARISGKDDYPLFSSIQIPIQIVDEEEILAQIHYHIKLHEASRSLEIADIPHCSEAERWQDQTKWAVEKTGRKTAVRVLYGWQQAMNYIRDEVKKDKELHFVTKRPGIPKRCINYCPTHDHCPWYQAYLKDQKKG